MVPKGDILFVSPTLNHRMPHVFANPDTYDPDRFDNERAEDKKTQFSYVGFGAGRHECMGQQFAYMQVKTIWTILLRDFGASLCFVLYFCAPAIRLSCDTRSSLELILMFVK